MKGLKSTANFLCGLIGLAAVNVNAQETDFSCIHFDMVEKHQVVVEYLEYNLVFENNCPGAVYWAFCLETLDPWSNKLYTQLEPTGLLDEGKKAKVNIQMKQVFAPDGRDAYQKFYAARALGLEPGVKAQCKAKDCEAQKRALRTEVANNDRGWQALLNKMKADATATCPKTNWNAESQESCIAEVEARYEKDIQSFSLKHGELEAALADIDPVNCEVFGGY